MSAEPDVISMQVNDLATRLEQVLLSLPADEDLPTPRLRDANYGRRVTLMVQRGPLRLAEQLWREANARFDAEERRLWVLQQFVDEHQPLLDRMPSNHPDRADLTHSMNVVKKGIDFDSGAVKLRLVQWLEPRGGLRVLRGGGLINTTRRVEQYAEQCRTTWADLDAAIERVRLLLDQSVTVA